MTRKNFIVKSGHPSIIRTKVRSRNLRCRPVASSYIPDASRPISPRSSCCLD
jgi:hypothetical protein